MNGHASIYIPVHDGIDSHPKTLLLARELRISVSETVGLLVRFWLRLQRYACDGIVAADAAVWPVLHLVPLGLDSERADAVARALVSCGYVNVLDDGSVVAHDWDLYGGKLATRREDGAKRVKAHRERCALQKRSCNAHVTVTGPLRNALEVEAEKEVITPPSPPPRPWASGTEPKPQAYGQASPPAVDWQDAAERFMASYPRSGRRTGRGPILAAFRRAVEERRVDPEAILAAAAVFAHAVSGWPEPDRRFVPSAVTWLDEDRWEADPATWSRDGPRREHDGTPEQYAGLEELARERVEGAGR